MVIIESIRQGLVVHMPALGLLPCVIRLQVQGNTAIAWMAGVGASEAHWSG